MRYALSLSQKLFTIGLIGVCATIVAGVAGYRGLSQSDAIAQQLNQAVATQRSQMTADMMHDGLRAVVAVAQLDARHPKPGMADTVAAEAKEKSALMIAQIDSVRIGAVDSIVRAAATEIRPRVVAYTELGIAVSAAAYRGGEVQQKEVDAFEEAFSGLEKEMGALGDAVEASSARLGATSRATAREAKLWQLGICIVALLLAGIISQAIVRAIRRPIVEIAEHAATMAQGDFSKEITYEGRDEIGSLADSFRAVTSFARGAAAAAEALSRGDLTARLAPQSAHDVLANSVNRTADTLRRLDAEIGAMVSAGARGDLAARADASAFDGAYRELVSGVNCMLDETLAPIAQATSVLAKVAERDLRVRVEGEYCGDHAKLTTALNTTLDHLELAFRQVRLGSQEVTVAADQIASGAQSMAEGSIDQVNALEEINANLKELSSLSRDNATEANEVQRLADGARTTADAGVEHMNGLNDAMDALHSSVGESARIIRTIDEIAFQTNLLALNAAVEAARAGDAGRGFAVVAEEVRSLALRSAAEAQRSASVIERSLKDASRGIELKELTRTQLTELATTVSKVSAAMQAITRSSEQQSEGIRQILIRTDQINRVTQESASQVQASASAAQELTAQAESLYDMAGEFDISESERVRAVNRGSVAKNHGRQHKKVRAGRELAFAE